MQEIQQIYKKIKNKIKARLAEFDRLWESAPEEDIFAELVFCLLTPQSKAKSCWAAVKRLNVGAGLVPAPGRPPAFAGAGSRVPLWDVKQISKCLTGVRFHNNKAKYIIEAREKFSTNGKINIKEKILKIIFPPPLRGRARVGVVPSVRHWLVKNIKGMGYKEASHFLRNIGFGKDIAILDRHILKNLKKYGVIKEIPKTITPKNYFLIEEKMKRFAEKIKIPLAHLDFVFWYKEAGDVFK